MTEKPVEPLISIALCTYNGARYLKEQLDSISAQRYRNIEIVAVDDCSTDATLEILKEHALRDARFRVLENPTNLGFKRNFVYAMSLCKGKFIAPCDQDDIWLPEKLDALHAAIGPHPMVYCDSEVIDADGRPLSLSMSNMFVMAGTDDTVIFAAGNCVSGHAMLFRRELIDHAFPVPEAFFHDWWLAAVATTCGGIVYCNRKLIRYRQHAANVTDVLGDRLPAKPKRSPGYRWNNLHEFGARIECLAALPGKHQSFLQKFSALWSAREHQWFSPALAIFMFRHGSRIYSVHTLSRRFLTRHALKFFWGLRLKRVINKYAYTPT